ncbi:hypothetical protein OG216_19555 [Streptomycetaceae bacterium NBC_01309]
MSDDGLADVHARIAQSDIAKQATADLLAYAARHRDPEPPQATVIPMPDLSSPGIARFPCPRRCGWSHHEPTDPGPSRLIVAIDPTGAWQGEGRELGEMISLNAEARFLAQRAHIEAAIADHCLNSH